MKNYKITDPTINREYNDMRQTRDLFNGTSFKMNDWAPNQYYYHDDKIIDFVSHKGCFLFCKRTHISSASNEPIPVIVDDNITGIESNPYWSVVTTNGKRGLTGETGPKGEQGPSGSTVIDGNISATATAYESANVAVAASIEDGNVFTFSFGLPRGADGQNGTYVKYMYAISKSSVESPSYDASSSNPGSLWSAVAKARNKNEYVWQINADFRNNVFVGPWSNPMCISGFDGSDGVVPNYKTYIYKKSDTRPDAPTTTTDLIPSGWEDYPTNIGQWWQCVGTVNGITKEIVWSEVLPVNGQDGQAKDGKYTEMRFAVNNSSSEHPSIDLNVTDPEGWTIAPPTVGTNQYLWMTSAVFDPNATEFDGWNNPVRISGEKGATGDTGPAGPQGPTGSQGVSGIPGVSFAILYTIGSEDTYDNNSWKENIDDLTLSDDKPYIWCKQGRIIYDSADDTTGIVTYGKPFKLSGTNGIDGNNGNRGQIIYPMGIYDSSLTYYTDEYKAPYVYDTSYDAFYVLNASQWDGSAHKGITPGDNATSSSPAWVKFESFEAVYAKIGIIANGLIGSAVFNGDYMFSQQGICGDENENGYAGFNPDDPLNENNDPKGFTPNLCLNLKTGEIFGASGSMRIREGEISFGNVNGKDNGIALLSDTEFGTNMDGEQYITKLSSQILLNSNDNTFEYPCVSLSSTETTDENDGTNYDAKLTLRNYKATGDNYKIELKCEEGGSFIKIENLDTETATNITSTCVDTTEVKTSLIQHKPIIEPINISADSMVTWNSNVDSSTILLYKDVSGTGVDIMLPSYNAFIYSLTVPDVIVNDEVVKNFCTEMTFVNVGNDSLILHGRGNTNDNDSYAYLYQGGSNIETYTLKAKAVVTIIFVYNHDENLEYPYTAYIK